MNSAQSIKTSHASGTSINPIEIGGQVSPKSPVDSLIQSISHYDGPERRASRRVPRTLEISVQPLNDQMIESGKPFFAITRDISQGGLAYLSSRRADFDKVVIALNEAVAPGIVCRICKSTLIHSIGGEEFYLTNVEFLYVHKRRK